MSRHGNIGVKIIVILTLLISAGLAFLFRQEIVDRIVALQYKPSSDIVALADKTTMNDKGRLLFYVARPQLDSSSSFNEDCERQEKGNAILGCYRAGKIYIYDIKDERLSGIKEVTAAHEMLHVAYERLSNGEKAHIDELLEAEYGKQNNPDLNERMEYYARTEPGQRANELHSIIGTEFLGISAELEDYYATYFSDRSAVVNLFSGYSSRFDSLSTEASTLQKEIDRIYNEVEAQSKQYNESLQVINQDIADFNYRAETGMFSSQAEFSQERQLLIQRSEAIEGQRQSIEAMIQEHQTKVGRYNEIVDESNSLHKSLDSSLAPPPKLQGITE